MTCNGIRRDTNIYVLSFDSQVAHEDEDIRNTCPHTPRCSYIRVCVYIYILYYICIYTHILYLFVCSLRMLQLRTKLHTYLRFPIPLSRYSCWRNESSVMAWQFCVCIPSVLNHTTFTKLCEYNATGINRNSVFFSFTFPYSVTIILWKHKLIAGGGGSTQLTFNLEYWKDMETSSKNIQLLKSDHFVECEVTAWRVCECFL
jgi:hypothetical protein